MQLLGAVTASCGCADALQVVSCHALYMSNLMSPTSHCSAASCQSLPPSLRAAEGAAPSEVNSGANAFVYWTCPYPGGPWTQLPPVTPAQIKAARQVSGGGWEGLPWGFRV